MCIYIYIYTHTHGGWLRPEPQRVAPRGDLLRGVPGDDVVLGISIFYAQSSYQLYAYEHCLTQSFPEIPYGPGNSTP